MAKKRINSVDTAASYLTDTTVFKDFKLKLTSKINPDIKWISYNYCKEKINWQIKKLYNDIDILLFHDVNVLYKNTGKKFLKNKKQLKKTIFKKLYFNL